MSLIAVIDERSRRRSEYAALREARKLAEVLTRLAKSMR